ncbi:hypothetical protein [Xanthobacter tagetidis]|uniref:DUF308 domain-containing protein n=1 Tax=Xanthobacter tagetidis TaxID=60216 RepID=A0A3L7AI24_9HYPH|nr:hypothetical protein [Xanthobacter tagetidis]MBB6306351.1 hypothetical protein [Xanthobacter tagetidis]RLP79615.1 hypothetical protein D9R14_08130 [Xanthobacter tagetidis]
MWWFLVLLGVLIALAGLSVIGLGAIVFVSSIGNTLITTGAVAASGGFVITAMGLVLRQLERLSARIEAGLSGIEVNVRPVAGEVSAQPAPVVPAAPAVRGRLGAAPRPTTDDLGAPEGEGEDKEQDEAEAAAPSSSPPRALQAPRPTRTDERSAGEERAADPMLEARRQRLERRVETETRAASRPEPRPEPRADPRPGPRSRYEAPGGKAAPAPRPAPASPAARRAEGADEPRILKSGIVGGMAYTLYSDGSIQAELPDGVVRFASLQELRDHVSQAQQNR